MKSFTGGLHLEKVLLHFSFYTLCMRGSVMRNHSKVPADKLRLEDLRHEKFHCWTTLEGESNCISLHTLPEEIFDEESFKVPAGEQLHCVICLDPQTSKSSFSSGRCPLAVAGSLLSLHSQVRGTLACLQSVKNRGQ